MPTITFKGTPVQTSGPQLKVGDPAPDFNAQKIDMSVYRLSDHSGRTRILVSVPSLDTPVCDMETRRFNSEAATLENCDVVCISMDLPFAQKRWCGAAGADHVVTVSDHQSASFGTAYGTLINGGPLDRILARAVFVVSPEGTLRHVEYVAEIAEQPDYDSALAAARNTD